MKVGIIGGGAAGLFAAIMAARCKDEVTIFEHNDRVGKKLLSTGNGRCNYTNVDMKIEDFYGNTFAFEIIKDFDEKKVIDFFAELGIVPYIKNGYIYPYSQQASAILTALEKEVERLSISVCLETKVVDIKPTDIGFSVTYIEKKNSKKERFEKLIVATGLLAAATTGSDGSFLPILKKLGVLLYPILPALCAIHIENKNFFKICSGVRAQGCIRVLCMDQEVASAFGELQFTDYGISGIPTFQVSRMVAHALENKQKIRISLDLCSHLGDARKLLEKRRILPSIQTVEDMGNGLFHTKLWMAVLKKAGISFNMMARDLSDKDIHMLVSILTNLICKVEKMADFSKSQVCTGGIPCKDLHGNLMYKKIKNLYFAGEIIDVDGKCGGYNLQWAWSSAARASRHD